jgi:glycosyltransferase involved in cell wall biosynthesis
LKISVVTPSFNQAEFLPQTLASVASQSHTDVEHIVVDPGSSDGSLEIARAAEGIVLINEPDDGQSEGISKGFAVAAGDVLAWLNSDDLYATTKTLALVAERFRAADRPDVVYGDVDFVDRAGRFLRPGYVDTRPRNLLDAFQHQVGIIQPGVFFRREVFDALGGPSTDYHYCMDYEYWVRMARAGYRFVHLGKTLALHRWWSGMKTSAGRLESYLEHCRVCRENFGYVHQEWVHRLALYLCTGRDGIVDGGAGKPRRRSNGAYTAILRDLYLRFNGDENTIRLLTHSDCPGPLETMADMESVFGCGLKGIRRNLARDLPQMLPLNGPQPRDDVAASRGWPDWLNRLASFCVKKYWRASDLLRTRAPRAYAQARRLRRW